MKSLDEIAQKIHALTRNKIQKKSRANELVLTHSSCAMEGSSLSLEEAKRLIEDSNTPKDKPLEHSLMIIDHFKALQYVKEKSKKFDALNEDLVKSIASLVMQSTGPVLETVFGTQDAKKGDFRKTASFAAGGGYFVSPDKIASRMKNLYSEVNEALNKGENPKDIFALSAYAHLELVTIHPFIDGNGRTARLLQNLILLKHQMPLLIIRYEKKKEYIAAIKESRSAGDIGAFTEFLAIEYLKG